MAKSCKENVSVQRISSKPLHNVVLGDMWQFDF